MSYKVSFPIYEMVSLKADPDDAAAGGVWTDPPKYFDKIVYPAYVKAHEKIFEAGKVEDGAVKAEWRDRGLVILDPKGGKEEMTRCFKRTWETIIDAMRGDIGQTL